MISKNRQRQLRRTIAPYVGQLVILSLVTLGVLLVSIAKNVFSLMLSAPIIWLLFAPLIYISFKYRIYWTDSEVCQQAHGGPDVCIKYAEITRITSETSKPAEWLAAARPFRRIVIYGERLHEDVFIDVSLKHFAADDVRELMRVVHGHRPDLALPKHWL